jgi:hypothetical protein
MATFELYFQSTAQARYQEGGLVEAVTRALEFSAEALDDPTIDVKMIGAGGGSDGITSDNYWTLRTGLSEDYLRAFLTGLLSGCNDGKPIDFGLTLLEG